MSKGLALFDSRAEATVAGLALAVLVWASSGNYLLFHSLVELFAVFVGFGIFALALNARRHIDNGAILVLGYGFFAVAGLDLLHTLAYKGMGVFPGHGADLATQLWVAARAMKAAAFLAAPFCVRRRVPFWPVFSAYAAVLAGFLLLIFPLDAFPRCYIEGHGLTPFKVWAEYLIAVSFALSALLLQRRAADFEPGVLRLLLLGLGFSVASELSFTLYDDVYGLLNQVGHYFKLGAFYCFHKSVLTLGFSRPQELLFRRLKQSREDLAESERALNEAQALARIGSYSMDEAGGTCTWSEELYRLLGYAPGGVECSRELLRSHIHAEDQERVHREVDAAFASLGRVDLEFRYIPQGGEVRFARGLGAVAQDERGERWLCGVIRDVTEEVRARHMREDVDRVLRHDLKTPLNAIVGLARLMVDEKEDLAEPWRLARVIEESGWRLLDDINRSLDLFRMEQGTYVPNPRPVDLLEVARRVRDDLGASLERKNLDLGILLDGRPAATGDRFMVLGEEALCYSLLANLLRNAAEASPPGQAVRILCRTGPPPELAVENQGAVPAEIRSRFFEKGVTFGKKNGTGLGTYSARLMARAMGGDISFTSSEQAGTTVSTRFMPPPAVSPS